MTYRISNPMVRDIQEHLFLRCVHHSEMISHMEVLW